MAKFVTKIFVAIEMTIFEARFLVMKQNFADVTLKVLLVERDATDANELCGHNRLLTLMTDGLLLVINWNVSNAQP